MNSKLLAVMIAITMLVLPKISLATDKGYLGFGTEATISGFFSPILKRVKVTEVQNGSPAAEAGLRVDDQILEANGKAISGAPAREMAGALRNVMPDQHLRLKVKHSDGTQSEVNIIAGTKRDAG